MTNELKQKLIELADKYENKEFLKNDPSKFMHEIKNQKNQEIVAFLSANLAFGKREQILKHIQIVLDETGNDISKWIFDEKYKEFFQKNDNSFYRTFTNNSMILFFEKIKEILSKEDTIGEFFKKNWKNQQNLYLHQMIMEVFPKECNLIPHSTDTSAKKLNMFLRWMVRTNSPVDLGLWTWFNKKNLLMPLDVHVMQEANNLGLISKKTANLKTCIELTQKLSEVFPNDPCKADFALFGLGVNKN